MTTLAPAPLYRDPLFYLALLAGPAVWLLLWWLQPGAAAWDKPFRHASWFLQLAVLYPVLEEIVFRGLLQELVRDYLGKAHLGPLSLSNALTSVLFTAAHFFYHPPMAALLVFFPSLVFGFFKERTGTLPAPILLHAFYNAGYLWLFVTPA